MNPDELEALVREHEGNVVAAWLAALAGIRDAFTVVELAELLNTGRFQEVAETFGPQMSRLNRAWNNALVDAGTQTAENVAKTAEIVFDFDMVNDAAVRAMQENNLRLVQQFTDQQRRASQEALGQGVTLGENPRQVAERFRDSIGLTQRQVRTVANYERLLRMRSPEALTRALRDRRFDSTIRRAIENDTPLTDDQIRRMVDRYRSRMIKQRAETIARTEAQRSVHIGQHEAMRQAVEAGHVTADQIVREWNTAADERVRDFPGQTSHVTMDGQKQIGLDAPFVSGAGNSLLYPTDPGAPAYDTINCRCVVSERLDLNVAAGLLGVQIIEE